MALESQEITVRLARWLSGYVCLFSYEDWSLDLSIQSDSSQTSIAPAPRNPVPSSGPQGYRHVNACVYTHTALTTHLYIQSHGHAYTEIHTYTKNKSFLKSHSSTASDPGLRAVGRCHRKSLLSQSFVDVKGI